MAGDTRDDASPATTAKDDSSTERPYQGKVYEVFHTPPAAPPESANVLPGGTANTAGGRAKEAGLIDALKTVKPEELLEVHKKPCVREALLTGILSGFGMASLRTILGGMRSCP